MNILIENAETCELLTAKGTWTRNQKDAATYRTTTLAMKHGETAPIGRFNVIGTFSKSPQITNLDEGCGTVAEQAKL